MSCDTQVTGSHDHSLRLWEKTDEPLILSEEREKVGFVSPSLSFTNGTEIVVNLTPLSLSLSYPSSVARRERHSLKRRWLKEKRLL